MVPENMKYGAAKIQNSAERNMKHGAEKILNVAQKNLIIWMNESGQGPPGRASQTPDNNHWSKQLARF